MIFEELVLENFGIYKGRHIINLIPEVNPDKRKPIVLFGALNGSGKTTLVDALQLILYGNSASQSNRNGQAYSNYLESLINKNSNLEDGASIELSMRIQRHQRDENIRLNRFWRKNRQGIKETFEVTINGEIDSFATEHWDEVVEEIIPRGIAHLFFFDGERIEQLADSEHAANIIETGLHTLLGLDLVDRLNSDLTYVERRRKKNLLDKTEKSKIEQLEKDVHDLQMETDSVYQKLASENNKLQKLEKDSTQLQQKYIKSGGKLFDSRQSLSIELNTYEERLRNLNDKLKELAAKSSPLLLVKKLLYETRIQIEQEEDQKYSKEISKILQYRDRSFVKYIREQKASGKLIKSINGYLKKDREKRINNKELNCYLNTSSKDFSHVSDDALYSMSSAIKSLLTEAYNISIEVNKIEEQISAIPSEEQLRDLIKEIDLSAQNIAKQKNTVDLLYKQYDSARDRLNNKNNILNLLLEKDFDIDIANEKNTRVIKHIDKVQETLRTFRRSVADKHIHVLEKLILESFQQLIRKTNLLSSIKIDPETFKLLLIDCKNKVLDAKKLSAGERQLLAVSILWGLAKASGRPLPTVIDTPLGRLDTQHRENLVKYYFPRASHQVILLSTDTEIVDNYFKKLKPTVRRTYQIEFDEKSESSHFIPGYFI